MSDKSQETNHTIFIGEEINVGFDTSFELAKKPNCPQRFFWRDKEFLVTKLTSEWKDFSRKGRFSKNMRSAHAIRASIKGSMGVGKFYFRVETDGNRTFDIYFDRSSIDHSRGKSGWFLFREVLKK